VRVKQVLVLQAEMRQRPHGHHTTDRIKPVIEISRQRAADATAGIIGFCAEGGVGIPALCSVRRAWQSIVEFDIRLQRELDSIEPFF
jgi:hypothetical protein